MATAPPSSPGQEKRRRRLTDGTTAGAASKHAGQAPWKRDQAGAMRPDQGKASTGAETAGIAGEATTPKRTPPSSTC